MSAPDGVGPPRRVPLAGAPNFRDLGGYPTDDGRRVRWGVLFRSGVLSELTDADVESVARLGVRTVVDLRSTDEVVARPDRLPAGTGVLHVPVVDVSASPATIAARLEAGDASGLGGDALVRGNRAFACDMRDGFGRALAVVMEAARRPVLVHCTAGKDRAGFASALILLTLGVAVDDVVDDYLLSNRCLAARHAALLADAAERLGDVSVLEAMLRVRAEYLLAGIEAMIDDFGSVDGYLRDALGVTDHDRARFRDGVLEP